VSVADLVDDVQTGTADPALVAIVDPAEDDPLHAAAPDAQPILDQRAGESSVFGADLPQPAADGVAESDGPAEGGADFEAGSTGEVRPGPLRSGGKTVRAPRNARPSRFDVVGDE
jgi:hypothetical protein